MTGHGSPLERQTVNATVVGAYNAALRCLSYRPRSEAEVRRRLLRRYPPEVVQEVIATLVEQKLLDDAAFARYWRENRERRHPKGQEVLRQELSRLGVSRETAEESLQGFDAEANAYRAAVKWAHRLRGAGYAEFRQRLWAYLQRRGFRPEAVKVTVRRLWRELADPLHRDQDSEEDE